MSTQHAQLCTQLGSRNRLVVKPTAFKRAGPWLIVPAPARRRGASCRGACLARLTSRRLRRRCALTPDGDDELCLVPPLRSHVRIEERYLVAQVVHLVRLLHVLVEAEHAWVGNVALRGIRIHGRWEVGGGWWVVGGGWWVVGGG